MRPLLAALRAELLRPRTLAEVAGAFTLGIAVSLFLIEAIPQRPGTPPLIGIAFSFALVLILQALAFGALHAEQGAWHALTGWIRTALCAAAALLPALVTGAIPELRMALIAGSLCVLMPAIWLALWRLAALLMGRNRLALQLVFILAVFANSALFWSRNPITAFATQDSPWGQVLPDGVMKLSPPLTIAAAWHQEASTSSSREGARFDIIRAPLTYDVWIGSYQAVPYPAILPRASRHGTPFESGVLLALVLWALPTLFFGEYLAAKQWKLGK